MSPVEHFDLAAVVGARTAAWRRVAFLICGDWATAEDIVQTSVIKLSRSWHRIEPAGLEQYARKVISRVAI
ncbi:MAG: sigma factor, partial [Nakamurella sp.]